MCGGGTEVDGIRKAPKWISESYGLAVLLFTGILFALVPVSAWSLGWGPWRILLLLSALSGLELTVFILGWALIHKAKLHNIRRSLLGFLVNFHSLSFITGSFDVAFAPAGAPVSRSDIYLDGITAIATISQVSYTFDTAAAEACNFARVFIGLLLVMVIVGSLAGSVVRKVIVE